MEYVDFFDGSRDLIQQLGEGIGLPESSSRFDAKMLWTIRLLGFSIFFDGDFGSGSET